MLAGEAEDAILAIVLVVKLALTILVIEAVAARLRVFVLPQSSSKVAVQTHIQRRTLSWPLRCRTRSDSGVGRVHAAAPVQRALGTVFSTRLDGPP